MKRLFMLLAAALMLHVPVSAGYGAPYWAKIYGSGDYQYEWINSMQQTADGGYILTGYIYSYPPDYDVWVLKLDAKGDFSWGKAWGGSALDEAFSVQQTDDDGDGAHDDGYIVAGGTQSFGAGSSDVCILKLDSGGDITWQRTYGGSSADCAYSIRQTSDGGFIAAGSSSSFGTSGSLWVLKLNNGGDIAWQRIYGEGSSTNVVDSIQQTSDGGYIVIGSLYLNRSVVWILKLEANGDITWQKRYADLSYDASRWASSMQQTADGGYIVACNRTTSMMQYSPWILRLDSSGTIVWQKIWGSELFGGRYVYSVKQAEDGGYIMGGRTDSVTHWGNMWILKLDSDGNVSWATGFASVFAAGRAQSVQQTMDGGYAAAGYYEDREDTFPPGPSGALVIKLDSAGRNPDCDLLPWEPALYTFSASAQDTTASFQPSDATVMEAGIIPRNISPGIITLCSSDYDEDGVPNSEDNCSDVPNGRLIGTCTKGDVGNTCTAHAACGTDGFCSMNQEESYPPQGNGIGDACECEPDFACDVDVDGTDASTFKLYFGRNPLYYPCSHINPCNGDFSCDGDVDGTDAALFKSDFGRSQFQNPCPGCVAGGEWCQYQ